MSDKLSYEEWLKKTGRQNACTDHDIKTAVEWGTAALITLVNPVAGGIAAFTVIGESSISGHKLTKQLKREYEVYLNG